jgi:hypothetical protein
MRSVMDRVDERCGGAGALRDRAFLPRGAGYSVAWFAVVLMVSFCAVGQPAPKFGLHYAPNGNFDSRGNYLPGKLGFNLADVSNIRELNALPDGVKGLVWIGRCNGVDATFLSSMRPFIGSSKLFGFYLADDPDPTAASPHTCSAQNLKAESDWIHANVSGAMTFIVLMNLSSPSAPSFENTYNPINSHVDLFGIDPYPCRTRSNGCDFDLIDRYVAAAEAWGVPRTSMVPVFQAFGYGRWRDRSGDQYTLPDAREMRQILARWRALIPNPVFDMTYSWGSQNGDTALEGAPHLHAVISAHIKGEDPPRR